MGNALAILDAAGDALPPSIPPAPPKDDRLKPNPRLGEALRNMAELAEQGYLIAFAAIGIAHDQDPGRGAANKFTMIHDHAPARVEMIGGLMVLATTLSQTDSAERMQSQARQMVRH